MARVGICKEVEYRLEGEEGCDGEESCKDHRYDPVDGGGRCPAEAEEGDWEKDESAKGRL